MPTATTHPQSNSGNALELLARMYYVLVGPAAMVITAMKIFQMKAAFSWVDVLLIVNLALMPIAARYVLVWKAESADSGPEGVKQWNKYALSVVGLGLVIYLAVRLSL